MAAIAGKKSDPQIRTIHTAIRTLGLNEGEYRAIYLSNTGQSSLKDMTDKERSRVLFALRKLGFKPRASKNDTVMADDPQACLVRHHWLTLAHYGELRNTSETALLAYVKRITGVARFEWLKQPQMTVVVETIKKWVERIEKKLIQEAIAAGKLPARPTGPFVSFNDLMQQKWQWTQQARAFLDGPHERRQ